MTAACSTQGCQGVTSWLSRERRVPRTDALVEASSRREVGSGCRKAGPLGPVRGCACRYGLVLGSGCKQHAKVSYAGGKNDVMASRVDEHLVEPLVSRRENKRSLTHHAVTSSRHRARFALAHPVRHAQAREGRRGPRHPRWWQVEARGSILN